MASHPTQPHHDATQTRPPTIDATARTLAGSASTNGKKARHTTCIIDAPCEEWRPSNRMVSVGRGGPGPPFVLSSYSGPSGPSDLLTSCSSWGLSLPMTVEILLLPTTIPSGMALSPIAPDCFDPARRALEKEHSRAMDARALASERNAADELRAQNEAFVRVGAPGRIDLSAARALA